MKRPDFHHALSEILARDPRYHADAYHFVSEALDYTVKKLEKPTSGPGRHVSGAELIEGVRQYAIEQFGPMAKTVLNYWGVFRCEDIGEIVFNMVDAGILGKTDQDRKEDFAGGFDFDRAFRDPFRPASKLKPESQPDDR